MKINVYQHLFISMNNYFQLSNKLYEIHSCLCRGNVVIPLLAVKTEPFVIAAAKLVSYGEGL